MRYFFANKVKGNIVVQQKKVNLFDDGGYLYQRMFNRVDTVGDSNKPKLFVKRRNHRLILKLIKK